MSKASTFDLMASFRIRFAMAQMALPRIMWRKTVPRLAASVGCYAARTYAARFERVFVTAPEGFEGRDLGERLTLHCKVQR